ncbi:MAG: SIS domain-containing protein [Bacteroidota bacterium]
MINIQARIATSLQIHQAILQDTDLLNRLEMAAVWCVEALKADKKILFCGNGGSASDAQHLAAELSGRFYCDRPPLFAEALHVNTSYLTAVANDYSYDKVYERAVQCKGRTGDILIGISTSGNSPNILAALVQAEQQGMRTIALTGQAGGKIAATDALLLNVPSTDTPRIQEAHILLGHLLCEWIETALFGRDA